MFLSGEMLLLLTLFLCFCLGNVAIASSVSVFLFGEMLLLIALFLCFCLAKCYYC